MNGKKVKKVLIHTAIAGMIAGVGVGCSRGGGETASPEKAAGTQTAKPGGTQTAKAGDRNACRARSTGTATPDTKGNEPGNTCAGKAGCA